MRRIVFICLALLLLVGPLFAENTVWQIGKFDGGYDDFALTKDHQKYSTAFPHDVTFQVGKDDPATAWPYIHPGPVDGWAGGRVHPFNIVFNLPDEPKGLYRLRIDMVNTHYAFPPTLEVRVNDRSDRLDVPKGNTDEALFDASKGKKYEMAFNVPASFLKKGENHVVLTSVNGSHMVYDALSLTNEPDAATAKASIGDIRVNPTMRFVRKNGQLRRVAQLAAQFAFTTEDPIAKVKFNGQEQTLRLHPGLFGSVATDIGIDDAAGQLEVTVESGGQSKSASCEVGPERHWKVYILPTAHVDIGYTDVQENVKVRHNENTSVALDLISKYPDFTWNTEAGWAEDIYLSMMPAERKSEFIKRAREGRMGCQVVYGNMLTGICSHEELIRNLYYTHSTAKQYGLPWEMAMSTDVPTQVWTLPSVLAGSGIKYFAAGLNTVRADSASKLFNKPFYWQGPDGASVLTWLTPGYGGAGSLGLAESVAKAGPAIDGFCKSFDRKDYPYDAAFTHGAFADNVPLDARLGSVVSEWNRTYAYPQIILCRGPEFFSYLEKNFKDKIPTISGDAGVYWEDGAGSSSQETAITRLAKEDLVTAEKLFSLSSALGGTTYPGKALDTAWKNAILYDEHTWGAAGSIDAPESDMTRKQWAYKAAFARNASKEATDLKSQAFDRLASMIKVTEPSVVVFNPLSWPVSQIVQTTADGKTVELGVDVPPMGFKVLPLNKVLAPAPGNPTGDTLENDFYRVEFDKSTGAVKSLYDKELKRELADQAAKYGINEYVYVSGLGDKQKDATRDSAAIPVTLKREYRYGSEVMKISSAAFNAPSLVTEVILYKNQKRIDFVNTIDKTPTYVKEGGYFAFPFGLDQPQFHIQLPNGVVNPAKNMLPGGCMAWYCAQDFVTASDEGVSVVWTALDSPLLTLCDYDHETSEGWNMPVAARNWPSKIDNGHIYGYVMNNYWFTNYKASQGGNLQFRFSLTSMKSYDAAAASRFGQTVRNPLLVKVVQPQAGKLTADSKSFVTAAPTNVVIQTIKQAESGQGTIIRLREVGGKPTRASVTLPKGLFGKAWKCNLVEDRSSALKISGGKVALDIPANGLATILVK